MPTFPDLVRPFQTRNITPALRVPQQNVEAKPPVSHIIGKGGSGQVATISYSLSAKGYADKKEQEI